MKTLSSDFIEMLEGIVHDWRKHLDILENKQPVLECIADMEKLIDELKEENK